MWQQNAIPEPRLDPELEGESAVREHLSQLMKLIAQDIR